MRREYEGGGGGFGGGSAPTSGDGDYFSDPYVSPFTATDTGGGGDYFSDPYVSPVTGGPVLGTGLYLQPGQTYTPLASRVGPTVSGALYGSINPNLPFGSLMSGVRGGGRVGRRFAASRYQSGFTVDDDSGLRRRRRRRNRFDR